MFTKILAYHHNPGRVHHRRVSAKHRYDDNGHQSRLEKTRKSNAGKKPWLLKYKTLRIWMYYKKEFVTVTQAYSISTVRMRPLAHQCSFSHTSMPAQSKQIQQQSKNRPKVCSSMAQLMFIYRTCSCLHVRRQVIAKLQRHCLFQNKTLAIACVSPWSWDEDHNSFEWIACKIVDTIASGQLDGNSFVILQFLTWSVKKTRSFGVGYVLLFAADVCQIKEDFWVCCHVLSIHPCKDPLAFSCSSHDTLVTTSSWGLDARVVGNFKRQIPLHHYLQSRGSILNL